LTRKPCPSGVGILVYATLLDAGGQWLGVAVWTLTVCGALYHMEHLFYRYSAPFNVAPAVLEMLQDSGEIGVLDP
jgi:hypothetical protein